MRGRQASGTKRGFLRLFKDRRGAVSATLTLMLIPLVGVLGMATEASSWFFTQRSMQNAADSAVVAAATNGCASTIASCVSAKSPYYDAEAKAVATKFGFTNAVANTTVAASNTATCPDGTATCYSVTITRQIPIYLTRLVGFSGDADLNGGRAQTVRAIAVARPKASAGTYCLTALGTGSGDGITLKGGPGINLDGCDIASKTEASCNGQIGNAEVHAYVATAVKPTNKQCGTEVVGLPPADIYADRASSVPTTGTCMANYGTQTISTSKFCSNNVTLTGTWSIDSDITITINNGGLNLNGNTIKTIGSGHLTIIFTGTSNVSHTLTSSNGLLDFQAPTTGVWKGIAVYQDPTMTAGTFDISSAGNSPTYNISGLLYMPKGALNVSGAINKHNGGDACIAIVAKSIQINGTGSILSNPISQCAQAGLALQGNGGAGVRAGLVL